MSYSEELTNYIKYKALKEGAILVGTTKIRKIEPVVIFGFPFTDEWFLNVPILTTKMLKRDYLISKHVQDKVASILKSEGYTANYKTILSLFGDFRPLAVSAGLGDWGRSGIIVNREHGAGLLFAAIFTNAPLSTSKPPPSLEEDHCISCGECIKSCPAKAFQNTTFNYKLCLPYSIKGCAECLKICRKKAP